MLGLTRLSRVDDVFNVQREMDRIFNQFWSDLPKQSAAQSSSMSFHVNATDDGWRIDVPLPGVDPKNVHLDVAGVLGLGVTLDELLQQPNPIRRTAPRGRGCRDRSDCAGGRTHERGR